MSMGASLKVGASNAEFNKAMKDMVSDMKNVKSEFTLASTQAKLFGTATDQLKAKQTQLTSALSIQNNMLKNQENQLKTLAQNAENLKTKQSDLATKIEATTAKYKESVSETGKDSEASKALKTEIDGLNESYAKLDKSIDSNNSKMNTVTQKMNGTKTSLLENNKALEETNTKLKTSSLDEFATKAEKVSTTTGNMANKLAPASTAIAGIGIASATASVEFEDSMAKVFTIADDTQVSYDDMKKSIMDLSSQTGISANEIAYNVYEAISSGQSTGDAVNFVTKATKLSKAGFTDSASSLDILTTTLNAYGMSADQVTNVSDKLITIQNLGKVTVDQLAKSMGEVIPTAKSAGVNLDNVSSAYALMTSKGVDSAQTTTYLNSMINELSKSGTTASTNLEKLSGSTFQQLIGSGKSLGDILTIMQTGADASGKSLNDMFSSQEASKAAMILSTNAGQDFNTVLGQMQQSTGATEIAFEKMDATSGSGLKKSFNDLKLSAINMGDALAPVTSSIANGLKDVTTWMSNLSEGQLKAIASCGGLVLGITGVLMAISGIAGGIAGFITLVGYIEKLKVLMTEWTIVTKLQAIAQGALNLVMSLNPIALIVIAIVALVAGIVLLYNKCDWFRNMVNELGAWLVNLFTVTIPSAFNSVVEWFNELPAKFSAIWETIKTAFSTGWDNIVAFFTESIPAWIASVVAWFNELPGKIGLAIGLVLGTLARWAVDVISWIATNVPIFINNIVTFYSELPGKIWTWLVNVVTQITNWGTNVLTYITTNVPLWIESIVTFFSELPSKIWNWLVEVVTNVVTWGTNMLTQAKEGMTNVYNGIVDTFTDLPEKMLDIGTNLVKGMWDGIKNSADWLMNKITDFADSIIEGFNDAFDIHSPARKMNPTGTFIVQGVGVGIEDETPNLENDINRSITSLTSGLKSTVDINANTSTGTTTSNSASTTTDTATTMYDKILSKMDAMIEAVDIKLNGKSIVDGTVDDMSEALALKSGRESFA